MHIATITSFLKSKTMEEKKKNEELQNRRAFFKNAANKALPIIGLLALTSFPVISVAQKSETDCRCTASCEHDCTRTCKSRCQEDCTSSCEGTCIGNCQSDCIGTCYNTCQGGCKDSCSGSCSNSCAGSSKI